MSPELTTNLKNDVGFIENEDYTLRINVNRNGNFDLIWRKTGEVVCEFQNNDISSYEWACLREQ
jgi:hypothetical protein